MYQLGTLKASHYHDWLYVYAAIVVSIMDNIIGRLLRQSNDLECDHGSFDFVFRKKKMVLEPE